MMNVMMIAIAVVAVLLLGTLIWVLFFSGTGRSKAPKEEIPQGVSMVRLRSAVSGRTVMEIYSDDLLIDSPVPFYSELEQEELKEETLIERWRRSDLSIEERRKLAAEMRAVGYEVSFDGDDSSAQEAQEELFDNMPDTVDGLLSVVENRSHSDAYRAEARRRLKTMLGGEPDGDGAADGSREESADSGEEEGDSDGQGGGQGEDDGFTAGEFEVDPVTGAPVSRDAAGVPTAPEGIRDVDEDYLVTLDFPHSEVPEVDDERDSRMAVDLMRFIARSFRKGLIEPELVRFAEKRLNLEANCEWTEEQRSRAVSRSDEFHALEESTIDELDGYIREVVEENAKAHTPSKKAKKTTTLGFDPHGGKNDVIWQRLREWGNNKMSNV